MMITNFLRLLFAGTLLCVSGNIYGQTESPTYKSASERYKSYYNQAKYDSLYMMFSPEMKKAMPMEQTAAFFRKTKSQLGDIAQQQFISYETNEAATYKLVFTNATFALSIALDGAGYIAGFLLTLPPTEKNITPLMLPFHNTWTVIWGGDTKENNYHVSTPSQKNAFDFLMTGSGGKSYKTDGKTNEDYYAFGQQIIAPCDAEVVLVVDGIKDNLPGIMNPAFLTGNTVVLRTTENEFLYFAHLKQHSVRFKEGQKITQGTVLGLCGNSGNSSQPHLHFHIQNIFDMNIAIGEKCYFKNIVVNEKPKSNHSPLRGEIIRNP